MMAAGEYRNAVHDPLRMRKFEVGDLVFAKLKGHPPWPSKITQIETIITKGKESVKYNVFFYGTHQSSLIRVGALLQYETHAKNIVEKYGRKALFHDALVELEKDLIAKKNYLCQIRNKSDWIPDPKDATDDIQQQNGELSFDESFEKDINGYSSDEYAKKEVKPVKKEETIDREISSNLIVPPVPYEIMHMEKVRYPDNEIFLIVHLRFDKEEIEKECKKIEAEEKMKKCFVRLERVSLPYPILKKQLISIEKKEDCVTKVDRQANRKYRKRNKNRKPATVTSPTKQQLRLTRQRKSVPLEESPSSDFCSDALDVKSHICCDCNSAFDSFTSLTSHQELGSCFKIVRKPQSAASRPRSAVSDSPLWSDEEEEELKRKSPSPGAFDRLLNSI